MLIIRPRVDHCELALGDSNDQCQQGPSGRPLPLGLRDGPRMDAVVRRARQTIRARPLRAVLLAACATAACAAAVASAASPRADVRFATFNASLNRPSAGLLTTQLADPTVDDQFRRQARNVAEVIQRIRPDVLLINEFDPLQNGDLGVAPGPEDLFRENFLEVSQNGAAPIDYPYAFIAASNTGVATGKDLNNNGVAVTTPGAPGYGDDAFGFGAFPGQFGMVVYSRYPIAYEDVRTFRLFKWKDMPGNLIPTPFYSPDEVEILRLSSKSHWDIPIRSDARPCTSSSLIRRRPSSTGPKIGTADGTSTRSVSGPTTSRPAKPATSTTTRESAAA